MKYAIVDFDAEQVVVIGNSKKEVIGVLTEYLKSEDWDSEADYYLVEIGKPLDITTSFSVSESD